MEGVAAVADGFQKYDEGTYGQIEYHPVTGEIRKKMRMAALPAPAAEDAADDADDADDDVVVILGQMWAAGFTPAPSDYVARTRLADPNGSLQPGESWGGIR